MKKILLVPALLIATIGFSQTFKSSQVLSGNRIKKELHTTIIKDSSIIFDGVIYDAKKFNETSGSQITVSYMDSKGSFFSFIYSKKKVIRITFMSTVDGKTINTVCTKVKLLK
jgi:hypothetical protein